MNTQALMPTDAATTPNKVLPYSIEAEQSVLGALMMDNRAYDQVSELVVASDFYRNEHQLIFSAMQSLLSKNQPFDILTVSEELKQLQQLSDVGGGCLFI